MDDFHNNGDHVMFPFREEHKELCFLFGKDSFFSLSHPPDFRLQPIGLNNITWPLQNTWKVVEASFQAVYVATPNNT